jgi:2'-5' RNA ligase
MTHTEITPTYRLFIAIKLPPTLIEALTKVQAGLRAAPAVRWSQPAQMHLTLQFLGDTSPAKIDPLIAALQQKIQGHYQPFSLQAQGLGVFPNLKRPRVIWAGLSGDTTRLHQLQQSVITATQSLGFAPEKRPFSPHLTLGRIKQRTQATDYSKLAQIVRDHQANIGLIGQFSVAQVSLMRSQLKPGGAIYTALAEIPF